MAHRLLRPITRTANRSLASSTRACGGDSWATRANRNLASSTRAWRAERGADSWATRAAAEGVRSRAAYKLEEINTKFGKFLRPGVNVVDLGAAPGGFSVVAAKLVKPRLRPEGEMDSSWRIYPISDYDDRYYDGYFDDVNGGSGHKRGVSHQKRRAHGRVVCVDLEDMDEVPGAVFVHGDAQNSLREIRKGLYGEEADVMLSDMAPKTSTDPLVSHVRSVELARTALNVAERLLRNGGTLVVKVFMGEDEPALRREISDKFVDVQAYKPKASRKKNSVEHYIVARRFVRQQGRTEPRELDAEAYINNKQ